MEKEEVLKIVQEKKPIVGEMERSKINVANWVALIVTCVVAIAFMIVASALGNHMVVFAIGAICFTWASSLYFGQYFIAKRKHLGILIGAILELIGALIMILNFILAACGVI